MTDDTKYNPIHTVQAPNLNKNLAYSTHNEFMHEPFDNSIFDQKEHFNQITFRPLTVNSGFIYYSTIPNRKFKHLFSLLDSSISSD